MSISFALFDILTSPELTTARCESTLRNLFHHLITLSIVEQKNGLSILQTMLQQHQISITKCTNLLTLVLDHLLESTEAEMTIQSNDFNSNKNHTKTESKACRLALQHVLLDLVRLCGEELMHVEDFTRILGIFPKAPALAIKLVKTLVGMCNDVPYNTPTSFFHLSGVDSALVLPALARWPCPHGYSVALWVRVMPSAVSIQQSHKRNPFAALYSFMTARGKGIELWVHKTTGVLKVKISSRATRVQELLCEKVLLQPNLWYLVCVSHVAESNSIRIYLNGELRLTDTLAYPQITESLTFNAFGTSTYTTDSAFTGHLSTVHFFTEGMANQDVQLLYQLGPDFSLRANVSHQNKEKEVKNNNFGFLSSLVSAFNSLPTETSKSHGDSTQNITAWTAVAEQRLAKRFRTLLFRYHPKCVEDGKNCIDTSPVYVKKKFVNCLLANVSVFSLHRLHDVVSCSIGGILGLLPIVHLLSTNMTALTREEAPMLLSETITLLKLLLQNKSNQFVMFESNGFSMLGFLLRCCKPWAIDTNVIAQVLSLVKFLSWLLPSNQATAKYDELHLLAEKINSASSELNQQLALSYTELKISPSQPTLFTQAVLHLLLDLSVWVRPGISLKVTREVSAAMLCIVEAMPSYSRRVFGVQRLLDQMRSHLSYDAIVSSPKFDVGDAKTMNEGDVGHTFGDLTLVRQIRALWLRAVKCMILSECKITRSNDSLPETVYNDLFALVQAVNEWNDPMQVAEFIDFLVELLREETFGRAFIYPCILKAGGVLLWASMFQRLHLWEHVQVSSIHLLRLLFDFASVKNTKDRKDLSYQLSSSFTLIVETLHDKPLFRGTYFALMELALALKPGECDGCSSGVAVTFARLMSNNGALPSDASLGLIEQGKEYILATNRVKYPHAISTLLRICADNCDVSVDLAKHRGCAQYTEILRDVSVILNSNFDNCIVCTPLPLWQRYLAQLYVSQSRVQQKVALKVAFDKELSNQQRTHQVLHRRSAFSKNEWHVPSVFQHITSSINAMLLASVTDFEDGWLNWKKLFLCLEMYAIETDAFDLDEFQDMQRALLLGLWTDLPRVAQKESSVVRGNLCRLVELVEELLYCNIATIAMSKPLLEDEPELKQEDDADEFDQLMKAEESQPVHLPANDSKAHTQEEPMFSPDVDDAGDSSIGKSQASSVQSVQVQWEIVDAMLHALETFRISLTPHQSMFVSLPVQRLKVGRLSDPFSFHVAPLNQLSPLRVVLRVLIDCIDTVCAKNRESRDTHAVAKATRKAKDVLTALCGTLVTHFEVGADATSKSVCAQWCNHYVIFVLQQLCDIRRRCEEACASLLAETISKLSRHFHPFVKFSLHVLFSKVPKDAVIIYIPLVVTSSMQFEIEQGFGFLLGNNNEKLYKELMTVHKPTQLKTDEKVVDVDATQVHQAQVLAKLPLICNQFVNAIMRRVDLTNAGIMERHARDKKNVLSGFRGLVETTSTQEHALVQHLQGLVLRMSKRTSYQEACRLQNVDAVIKKGLQLRQSLWEKLRGSLSRPGSPWNKGMSESKRKVFWMLDDQEDGRRMRRKLKVYTEGSLHSESSALGHPKQVLVADGESTSPKHSTEEKEDERLRDLSMHLKPISFTNMPLQHTEVVLSDDEEDPPVAATKSHTVNELQAEEKMGSQHFPSFSCTMVLPIVSIPGSLRVMPACIKFVPRITEENKYLFDESLQATTHGETPRPRFTLPNLDVLRIQYHRVYEWPTKSITAVYRRRFMLAQLGVEMFLVSGHNFFFHCESNQKRKKLLKALLLVLQRSPNFVPLCSRPPLELLRKSNLTTRWRRREISNFEYLMHLNTISGRTYNDLNQYPVFPWILQVYDKLPDALARENVTIRDVITDPALAEKYGSLVFRDLSKPMGALNEKRLQSVLERFASFGDFDIPPFHYGSHYSNAGIVLFYLMRLEPFASLHIELQAGKFDVPDRLFADLAQTFATTLTSMSSFKELIPEFFYLPEFLENVNQFDLGLTQDQRRVDDVRLPFYAGTSKEFIELNRLALESEYVSQRLHQWIDLIFGFKQTGPAALEANNIFFHLTYEGAVDLSSISDPILLGAAKAQIAQFGQTPLQLFVRPHASRERKNMKPSPQLPSLDTSFAHPSLVRCNVHANEAITHIAAFAGNMYSIGSSFTLAAHTFDQRTGNSHLPFTYQLRVKTAYTKPSPPSSHSVGWSHNGKVLFVGNNWDNSFRTYAVGLTTHGQQHTLKVQSSLLQHVVAHKDRVTCLQLGKDQRTLVTGSRDCTLLVWDTTPTTTTFSMNGQPRFSLAVSEHPRHRLDGHVREIVCVAIDTDLDICVSGSADGTTLVHSLMTGEFLRNLTLLSDATRVLPSASPVPTPSNRGGPSPRSGIANILGVPIATVSQQKSQPAPISTSYRGGSVHWGRHVPRIVQFTSDGQLVFFSNMVGPNDQSIRNVLSVCSINGRYWRSISFDAKISLNVLKVSNSGRHIVTGDSFGAVVLYKVSDLSVAQRFESTQNHSPVTALTFSTDQQYIFAGTESGHFHVYKVAWDV